MKTPSLPLLAQTSAARTVLWRGAWLLLAALALWASAPGARASATPPDTMTYQGFLVDGNGNALAQVTPQNYPVVFRIYSVSSGTGASLWSEQQIVTVDKGNFSVLLGEGTPVGGEARPALSSLFTGNTASDRYIGVSVTVGGNTIEILPRLRLAPSPYAFLATSAASLVQPNGASVISYANSRVEVAGNLVTTSSGRIGIGTLAQPVAPLEVSSGGVAVTGASSPYAGRGLYLEGHPTFGSMFAFNYNSGQPMPLILNSPGGNVGIGTTVPARKLQIGDAGAPNSEGMIRLTSRSGAGGASRAWDIGVPETDEATTGTGYSFVIDDLGRAGSEFIVQFGSGNVGIGTATPSSMLQVGSTSSTGDAFIRMESAGGNQFANGLKLRSFNDQHGWDLINEERGGTGPQANGFHIIRHSSSTVGTTALFIDKFTGNVGLGTTAPSVPLDVRGFANLNRSFSYYAKGTATPFTGNAGGVVDYSILAERRIGASEFNAFSDARIKRVVGPSDTSEDLKTIQKLKVTDYNSVDQIALGSGRKKGFIAQEVQAVIPEAVTLSKNFVPDIFALASGVSFNEQAKTLAVTLPKPHPLRVGDRVRLLTQDRAHELAVIEVPVENQFVVGQVESDPKEVFVYGREVEDFLTLNYDRIFTTGIGAIQELDAQMETLRAENATLKERLAALRSQAVARDTRLEALEGLVKKLAQAHTGSNASAQAGTDPERIPRVVLAPTAANQTGR